MYCTKCGTELSDDSRFCYKCGAAVTPIARTDMIDKGDYVTPAPSAPPTIASNTTPQQPSTTDEGIYGLLGFILAFFVPIVGFILSIIGLNKKKNTGFATAGLILSIIFMVLIAVAIVLIVENNASSSYPPYSYYW